GGTNRAVLESASAEGDPSPFSPASLLWYPLRWREQLGVVPVVPAVAAALVAAWRQRRRLPDALRYPVRHLPPGWAWLIGCTLSGWLCTTLSPNKDGRYIAPVLPLVILLLARGWWQIGLGLQGRWGRPATAGLLGAGLLAAATDVGFSQAKAIQRQDPAPLQEVILELRQRVGDAPITLLVVPGSPELNEQNVTSFGLLQGGRILGRRLGRRREEHAAVLEGSEWILLATGDQGTNRPFSRELSHRVRADGRFVKVRRWPWSENREVELWQRRGAGPAQGGEPPRFDREFIRLARGMERGPAGLAKVFERIGPEHQLDGHFLYQERVRTWAAQRLEQHPRDADALWSQALLATLRNRPVEAARWYGRLEALQPANPWPAAYRAVVLMAGWNPGEARKVLEATPEAVRRQPVVQGLLDLSRLLSGNPLAAGALRRSLPEAIGAVEQSLGEGK
ncbi:MAG TPA: 4-amino-4-deoxy-L-arabinose transferase, partial [Cyanobium sp.]|nr:4-amino-4-deoxy-L-arabinose transferase [Cyanobium sp.]